MKHFRYSFLVAAICLAAAYVWGSKTAEGGLATLLITAILGVMEVSLSFDNAVVNASVLRKMDEKWRQLFLTVGILIAVFGMRLFFPLAIVAVATGMGLVSVGEMAISTPDAYARVLQSNHPAIAAMGGMFLLLVFLNFVFDGERKLHWLGVIEERLAQLGKFDTVAVFVALVILFGFQYFVPMDSSTRLTVLRSGLVGVMLHIAVSSLDGLFAFEAGQDVSHAVTRSGIAGFLYLEVLDASFSFDGVIGAFAITPDVVVIMLGLAIGALFVRSLTIYLVDQGTLDEYVYLEHGAHYAIGILALLMLVSIVYHVGEVVTGLTGVALIVLSFYSSVRHKKKSAASPASPVGVTLSKSGNVSLPKTSPNLKQIRIGLGWNARSSNGLDFDLDATLFMLGEAGKVARDEDFIYYNQFVSLCGSVRHTGDNRTGEGDGDDEAIKVRLEDVPAGIHRLSVCVTIYEAPLRRQNFGQVEQAFIRVVDCDSGIELARVDLSEDYGAETAVVFGEIYRHRGEWKFKAVGQGFSGGLEALCHQFGVSVT